MSKSDVDISNTKIINLLTKIHEENIEIFTAVLAHGEVPREKIEEMATDIDKQWRKVLYE